jgi:hypothetical protein
MAASLQPSTPPTDTRPSSAELKQSPPAFLDLADSVSLPYRAPCYSLAPLIQGFRFSDGEVGL